MIRKSLRLITSFIVASPFIFFATPAQADYCDVTTTTYQGRTVVIYKVSSSTQTCYANWIAPTGVTAIDIFAVAGGGSGGTRTGSLAGGGGGGGGGVVVSSNFSVTAGSSYALQVGIGGAAKSGDYLRGNNGEDTGLSTVIATGGGGGGAYTGASINGASGGSGGGGGRGGSSTAGTGNTPSKTPSQGNNGGSANSNLVSGGGGGAGGSGGAGGNTSSSGAGGSGVSYSVTGSAVTYAGGGGGSGESSGAGACSTNTGAREGSVLAAGAGAAHTGCGGGGGNGLSGAGGSGILVITYVSKSCAPTSTYAAGNVTLKFTDTFLCSWQVPADVSTVSVEVVGGGGGGGFDSGGGGGGGGYGYSASYSVTANSLITISVGQGGGGGISSRKYGIDGYASTFGSITANGGTGGNGCTYTAPNCQSTNNGGAGGTVSGATSNTTGKTGGNGYCYQSSGSCSVAAGAAVTGTTSSLDNSIIYGASGGGNDSSTIAANIGKGGGGGPADSRADYGNGVAGGSGVVVVKFAASTCSPTTTTSGEYKIESFTTTSSCKWQVPSGVTAIELLVVGGGGGGGYDGGGGGGGGGVIYKSSLSVTAGDFYNVVVGAGGAAGSSGAITTNGLIGSSGLNGDPSRFGSVNAIGGGGGGGRLTFGLAGASGGGAGHAGSNAGGAGSYASDSDSTTFGNSGGTTGGEYQGGSGGGGANAVGANSAATSSGAGGAGYTSSISGSSVIYGGGGGGGIYSTTTSSATGCATGGRGGTSTTAATAGTANTGCGGGGGGEASRSPAAGGSGIVVIRYLDMPTVSGVTISGTAKVGQTLTGSATVTGGGTSAYQWQASDTSNGTYTDISSATSTTFTLTNAQIGKFIKFKVTQTNSTGSALSTSSATSAVYLYDAPTLSSVTVTGTALSGSVITATPSASGEGTITYSYQWYRIITGVGTSEISGATSSSYTLTDSELMGWVYVSVIASNESSSSSAVIGSMPAPPVGLVIGAVTPTISGFLQSGQLLTGATSTTAPAGSTLLYKWLRSDTAAGTYSAISGATNSTYRLTSSDVGKYIKFQVIISNSFYLSNPSNSIATNIVIDRYTISYAAGGGSGSSPVSPTTVINGSTFTLPANTFTRDGYSFAGWSDGTNIYQAGDSYPAATGNVSLTATWTASSLTITYDSQGGSSISAGSTTTGGSIASSPGTPTRAGYTFNGWFAASTGGSAITFPYTHSQTASFTLYAQWTADTLAALTPVFSTPISTSDGFTVEITNYDSSYTWATPQTSSGSVSITSTIGSTRLLTITGLSALGSATLTQTTSRAGYYDGSATVTGSASVAQLSTPAAPTVAAVSGSASQISVTYTSIPNATSHKVRIYASGVLVGGDHDSFVSGSTISGLAPATTYTVTVTAIGDGVNYLNSAASSISSVTTNAAATVPVISTQPQSATKIEGESVTFTVLATRADGGTLTYQWSRNGVSIENETSSTLVLSNLVSITAGDYSVTVMNTLNGTSEVITSNTVTLTINPATFTVTYSAPDKDGGSVPLDTAGPYLINSIINLAGNTGALTRTGYGFAGWRTASDNSLRTANSQFTVTENTTFIAVWTRIYQLSFDANGGSGSMSVMDGPLVTIPTNTFTRSGYNFDSWNTSANGSGLTVSVGIEVPLTQNVILYAQWAADTSINIISFESISNKTYGDTFTPSVSASSGLNITLTSSTPSICTISSLSVTAIATGTCTITASQSGNGSYVAATPVDRSFTVAKKSLVITVGNLSAVVAGSVSDPSYSQSGLVTSFGDAIATPTYKYQGSGGTYYPISTSKPSKLGSYRISIDSITLSSGSILNYQVTFIAGELTIAGVSTNALGAISVKQASGDKTTELLNNFSDATTTYTIYVGADVSAVIATITRPAGSLITAQAKVNNSGWRKLTFQSNISSTGVLPLPSNINSISISTAASDQSVRLFTITIYRDTKSAPTGGSVASPAPTVSPTPAAQVVSAVRFYINNADGIGSGLAVVPMTPTFSRGTNSYTLSFTNLQSATIMKADFTGAGNTLRLKINSGPFNVIPNTGSSNTIALSVGTNIAILRVTSTASATPEDYRFELTRAAPNSALIPTLGTPTVSSTGFTVQITNYDNLFTWSATATAGGSVAISNTGLITVTGLSPSTTSVLAVTSLRAGYANGRTTLSQSTSSS